MNHNSIQFPDTQFIEALSTRKHALRAEYLSSGTEMHHLPITQQPEFAFVGRSNVGKSSLLNFIAGQNRLAKVSHTPGRTQMINLFSAEKGSILLADLPGYGYAESPNHVQSHWHKSIRKYFEERQNLVAIFLLLDIRREVQDEDTALAQWFQELGLKIIVIQTKCDKIHKSQWHPTRKKHATQLKLSAEQIITTSADKHIGLEDIFATMAGILDELHFEEQREHNDKSK